MVLAPGELPEVAAAAHAVIAEAKKAGVYVFGGGVEESIEPVRVSADGSVSTEIYPGSRLKGGFTVLEVPTREEAVEWGAPHRGVLPVRAGATRVHVRPGELMPASAT